MLCGGGASRMAPPCCVPPDGMSSTFCVAASAASEVEAIDVHGHYGQLDIPRLAVTGEQTNTQTGGLPEQFQGYGGGGTESNIATTIVSPLKGLFPTGLIGKGGCDAFEANKDATTVVAALPEALMQWAVVNPRQPETYAQAEALLADPKGRCAGLKIHPECHCYHIAEFGEELFAFARKHHALVMCHSGHRNSHPRDYLPFADASPECDVILAHLGNSGDIDGPKDPTHHVQAIAASKRGNVYVDTSSAAGIQPHLLEYAVEKIGAEKILFGTDTPLYFTAMQRARIDSADLPDEAKQLILRGNAERLLSRRGKPKYGSLL